jgi:hypothetical protein
MARIRNGNHITQAMFCLLSLLMLMTLPIQRAHQFEPHYRGSQIRRTFERHSALAHSNDAGAADRVNAEALRPTLPDPCGRFPFQLYACSCGSSLDRLHLTARILSFYFHSRV